MSRSNVARGDGRLLRRVLFPPTYPLRIMFVGDSQTAGNGGPGNEAAAFREACNRVLKGQRGALRYVGNAVVGPTGRDSVLSDWRIAATGGFTIQQADAQATAAEALDGPADVYVVLAGTNNIAAGDSVPTMVAAMLALVAHRLAANPSAYVLILDLYPWVAPAVNFAAQNAKRLAFNAALQEALAGAFRAWQVLFVPAGSLLSPAHMNATGIHANYAGNNLVGQQVAEAIVRVVGSNVGASWPRDPMRRAARPAVYINNEFGQLIRIPAQAGTVTPLGAVSFSYGLTFYPTDRGAVFERSIATQYPGAGVRNIWLNAYSSGLEGDNVQCFVGTDALPVAEAQGVLRLNTLHAIMVSADIATKLVQLWIFRAGSDGRSVNTMGAAGYVAAPWNLTSADFILGAVPTLDGMPGVYSDFWMAVGHAAQPEEAERYFEQMSMPTGTTAYYRLDEGAGTDINPSSGYPTLPVGLLTGNWVAAGVAPTPWDFGEVNDSPLRLRPTQKVSWFAEASATAAVAQVMPVGSGAASSAALTSGALVTAAGELSTFYVEYSGNAANVGGQEVAFDLLLNGVSIATIGGLASDSATPSINFVHFPAVQVAQGDKLQVTLTPSALLTQPLVAIGASAS